MNITCFYEPLIHDNRPTKFSEDCLDLVKLWEKSWSKNGWTPIVLSLQDAKKHPRYDEINLKNYSSNLYKYSINESKYLELCYSRWFAYGIYNGAWCDYDVMNYGFRPEDITTLIKTEPVFFDAIGACGFSTIKGHNKIIEGFIEAYQTDTIINNILLLEEKYQQPRDISDMHINRRQGTAISFLNNLCEDNFSKNKWRTAKLVHYHNGLWNSFINHECKSRTEFIRFERPI